MRAWILERFQVYARVSLLLAVFLSPIVFSRLRSQDVFNLLKFTSLWVFGLGALALMIIWSAERRRWFPRFNILVAAAAFIVACVVATLLSENPALSLVGLYHRYGGLLPFTLYALILTTIVGLYWEKPLDLRDIAVASAAASVVLLTYVLIQAVGLDWIPWKDSTGKSPPFPVGTMGNSNFAGGYLGIAIPLLLYVALSAKEYYVKMGVGVLVGLDALALWFTQTRGGFIAAGVGLLVLAFLNRHRLPRWAQIAALVAVGLATIVAVLVLWHPGSDKPPGPLARVEALRTGTFEVRTFYWTTAFKIFLKHPVAGVGLDLYYANYPLHRLPEDGAQLGLTITDKPHNIYLEYMANAGILGIGTYLSLIGLALWYAFKRLRHLEGDERLLLAAFVATLAGYLAQGVFSIDVPPLAVMGWICVGAIAVIADPKVSDARRVAAEENLARGRGKVKKGKPPTNRDRTRGKPARWGVHLPVGLATIGLILIGLAPLAADAKARTASSLAADKTRQTEAKDFFLAAARLNPLEATYLSQAANVVEGQAQAEKDPSLSKQHYLTALDLIRRALQKQPGNIFYVMAIARVNSAMAETDASRFPEAERWWRVATDLDPTDWDVRNRYALLLNAYANAGGDVSLREKSAVELRKVVTIKPDYQPAWVNLSRVYRALGKNGLAREAMLRAVALSPDDEALKAELNSIPG
ncbi:MAG TPA: O-antigen ligase family protein [Actinomycetota bacterium]|nr:O-antigen ligase family protein [Actinomycetota bacterium]